MKIKIQILQLVFVSLVGGCTIPTLEGQPLASPDYQVPQQADSVKIDDITSNKIDSLVKLRTENIHKTKGDMISLISREFIDTPYVANMLQGSITTPEKLVIDFRGLDCFTYLDYVEAMSKSNSRQDFIENLIRTRYVGGDVNFLHRRHFFSDWAYQTYPVAQDVTAEISPLALVADKHLNLKADGTTYLPGLPVVDRRITYIPAADIDAGMIGRLKTGDYIGIYTNIAGLDVTHVGIFVMTDKGPMFRNASSKKAKMKVVDSPFLEYVAKTTGIIVLRSLP